jgi:hypothetical protein
VTSPTNVGSAEVDIVAEVKGLAKTIRTEFEAAFKGLDLHKLIQDEIGKHKYKVPVEPEFDDKAAPKTRKPRAPKVPDEETKTPKIPKTEPVKVPIDPVFDAFRAELQKQVKAAARDVVKLPVDADTDGLKAELASQLAEIQQQLKATIPVEPEDRTKLQAKLQAELEEISHRLKAQVHVDVDVDTEDIPARVSSTPVPVVHVELDPDTAEYEAKVKAAVAKNRTQKIKLDVDNDGLDAIGGLFKGILPDIGGVGAGIRNITDAAQQFASSAAQGGSQLAAGVAQAAGPVGTVVSLLASAAVAMGALSGAAILAVPALTAVAGAAAAIPAALSGVGAAVATLGLGFKGISEAFKPKTGGGGGGAANQAAQQARQVASASRQVEAARRGIVAANRAVVASERSLAAAERGLAAAQQNVVEAEEKVGKAQQRAQQAQVAVNQARKEAVEDLDDLNRSLRGAQLGEQEAALAVTDALRELNAAKLTGNIPDIQRADLAYQRAVLSLEDAKDATQDLQAQSDDATAKGVEGSDKVQSALAQQADAYDDVKQAQQGVVDAQRGVLDAQDSLASAQDGVASALDGVKSATDGLKSAQDSLAQSQQKVASGAGAVAQQVTKLAPSAQQFVNAVKALKPAFESLRLDVQERLFRGLGPALTDTFRAWESQLHVTLGSFADTFNGFFKDVGTAVSNQDFIKGIATGAEGFRQLLEKVGSSITTSLIPAFGALSEAAGPFLSVLGDEVAGIVTSFSNWILRAKESGELTSFFDRASNALHDIFTTGKLVTKIVGDLFTIITGSQESGDQKSALDSFNSALEKVHTFLSDPKNQQKIRDIIADCQNALIKFGQLSAGVSGFLDKLKGLGGFNSGTIGETIGRNLLSGLIGALIFAGAVTVDAVIGFFSDLVDRVKKLLGIKSPSTVFAEIGRDLLRGLVNGMQSAAGLLSNAAVNVKNTVVNGAKTAGTWLYAAGQNIARGAGVGIDSWRGNVAVSASNLRPGIFSAVAKDAASLLYGSGQNMGYGLAKGIQSTATYLGQVAANTAIQVANKLNAALKVHSPSRVTMWTGQMVGEGLALGIESRGDQVQAAAEQLAALAVPDVGSSAFGAGLDAQISRTLQVGSQQQVQLSWKSGMSGDGILDAIAQYIDIRHNGNVQAALSRT